MTREESIHYIEEFLGGKADHAQAEQLFVFYEMLVKKNEVMNLTAITEFHEVVEKHFLDSVLPDADFSSASVIDVGTGAGFPGIPLKILNPGMKLTLMDSLNKRCLFLQEVVDALKLTDVTIIHSRAEELGRNPAHREKYDFAVSRAVANLATLSEYCIPFVKVDGYFLSYKSGKVEEELEDAKKAIFLLGGKVDKVENKQLPGSEAERDLIYIRKVSPISKKYPRKAGTPSKDPLK